MPITSALRLRLISLGYQATKQYSSKTQSKQESRVQHCGVSWDPSQQPGTELNLPTTQTPDLRRKAMGSTGMDPGDQSRIPKPVQHGITFLVVTTPEF